jgi:hypothetical protein
MNKFYSTKTPGQSDSHLSPGVSKSIKSDVYNVIPPRAPPNLGNPNLYGGRSTKPIPLELSLPLRWQRGAQFLAVSLSISLSSFLLQLEVDSSLYSLLMFGFIACGIWGVLFADFGNGDREIVFSPVKLLWNFPKEQCLCPF